MTVRSKAAAALPGVAIAVALVPPLSTAGITLQRGEPALAEGALLLFATNLSAIILAAGVVFTATGFVPRTVAIRQSRKLKLTLGASLLAVVAVAVPLARHSAEVLEEARHRDAIEEVVERWIGPRRLEVRGVDAEEERGSVRVTVDLVGAREPRTARGLAGRLARRIDRRVRLRLRWTRRSATEVRASP